MSSTRDALLVSAGVAAAVAVYVVVHEHRRKSKKVQRARANEPIPKDTLLKILSRSAEAAKVVITKLRVEIGKMQAQRGLSDEQATMIFNQNFEVHLDRVIAEIRAQFGVTEKAMDASFKLHQGDADVKAAIHSMRVLGTAQTPPPNGGGGGGGSSSGAAGGGGGGGGGAQRTITLPASLTREKLREIMKYNNDMLKKELLPVKEKIERARAQGRDPAVDPAELSALQAKIAQQVQRKYGVTDEQVMAAVEHYNARNDPAFKEVLEQIARTLMMQ
jgi:hypothetical protein